VSVPWVSSVVHPRGWEDGEGGLVEVTRPAPGARPGAGTWVRRHGAGRRIYAPTAVGDAVGVAAACLLVAWAEPWLAPRTPDPDHWGFALVTCAVILGVLTVKGAYASARRRIAPRVADDLGALLAGLAVAGVCLLALDTLGSLGSWVPPAEIGLVLATAVVVVPACREAILVLAARNPANVARVVIVGAGTIADYLTVRLSRSRLVDVIGIVDDMPDDLPLGGQRVLGTVEDLPRLCVTQRVDRVVIAFPGRHPGRSAQVLQELRGIVDIDVVVRYYELASWESRISDVTGLSLVTIGRAAGPLAVAAKRLSDIVVAAIGLALSSPVLALVAIAVRLESRGPVLFRQTRVGRDRRPFRILKFRTMVAPSAASAGPREAGGRATPGQFLPRTPLDTVADPALVTRVGRFLRRSGLDELPQLVNVLRGEMSLVGPRPFIAQECADLQGPTERRFDVRPGMTGMWQVCGQHEVSFEELCRLDVQYATSWSLRGDLRILARTPSRLVRGSAPGR
jgi:exopolysaccharide biosynthesis polyprenyl glycosylphosphotransferase